MVAVLTCHNLLNKLTTSSVQPRDGPVTRVLPACHNLVGTSVATFLQGCHLHAYHNQSGKSVQVYCKVSVHLYKVAACLLQHGEKVCGKLVT